jgi:hypothetical protein
MERTGQMTDAELDRCLKEFWRVVDLCVRREHDWILKHISSKEAYKSLGWHKGVCAVYEKNLVWLIIRELSHDDRFPHAMGWEVPYVEKKPRMLDLAIYDKTVDEMIDVDDLPACAIEVKFCILKRDVYAVAWDLVKILGFHARRRRVLVVVDNEQIETLKEMLVDPVGYANTTCGDGGDRKVAADKLAAGLSPQVYEEFTLSEEVVQHILLLGWK